MLPNYATWYGLVTYWMRVSDNFLFFMKMGNNLETIYIEGQGHIFTTDLIFGGSMCHAEGSCVQWTVFLF